MLYSFSFPKQTTCYSQFPGWQPELTRTFVCTCTGASMMWQPSWRQHEGTNLLCSMKNPRKSPGNPVKILVGTLKSVPQDMTDLPFFTDAPINLSAPLEPISPEEESFRTFLHSRLPRHKAPQALRERIKNAIKKMPD